MTTSTLPIRTPRSTRAATELCERFAGLSGAIEAIEAARNAEIAAINARYDPALIPMVAERDLIAERLEPWWATAAAELTQGKRKSIELGGCLVGTRTARTALAVAGEEVDVIDLLSALRWAKPFLRTKISLDRTAILKAIDGPRSAVFAELGLSARAGEDVFFVTRAEQGGTVTGAAGA